MLTTPTEVTTVLIPRDSAIRSVYQSVCLSDAYSIVVPHGTTTDPEQLARHVFAQQSFWVRGLLVVRDTAVAGLGLKTTRHLTTLASEGSADRVGFFKVYGKSENEIILGEDDKHLDFRLSLLLEARNERTGNRSLVLSTVVQCHNLLGRAYIVAIEPFHRLVAKSSLRQAAIAGWPKAANT